MRGKGRSEWSIRRRKEERDGAGAVRDSYVEKKEKERESSGRESGGVTAWFNVIYVPNTVSSTEL